MDKILSLSWKPETNGDCFTDPLNLGSSSSNYLMVIKMSPSLGLQYFIATMGHNLRKSNGVTALKTEL